MKAATSSPIKLKSLSAVKSKVKAPKAPTNFDGESKEFEALFEKLVPSSGMAKTLEGEILRAVGKLVYRFFNDGDMFTQGYGCETAGPSATYLLKVGTPKIKALIRQLENYSDAQKESFYQRALGSLVYDTVAYVEGLNGKYTKGNTIDSRSIKSNWTDDEDDEDDEY